MIFRMKGGGGQENPCELVKKKIDKIFEEFDENYCLLKQ